MYFNDENNFYTAIIGDMENSRLIADREKAQIRLKNVLSSINEKYSSDISAVFMITLGDEFQGLLNCGRNVIKIIEEIEYSMYPIKIRFGIGIGDITTEINHDMPLGADGPAYYNARDMIDSLKALKGKASEYNIKIKSGSNEDILLNTVFSLLYTVKNQWTDKQREIVHFAYSLSLKQVELAERFNAAQSTIQQILKRGDYARYKNAMEVVEYTLSKIQRK